tara:strand:+ start:174 stop:659 length:486 start_codon:yes stop_codon:yes gene_type:complete
MIEVIPFHGLLYNVDITGPLHGVTAPPYDVISPDQQEALYQKNPHNVIRLILGKEYETDSESDNRYTRSAKVFEDWTNEGVLKRDNKPGFYLYSQEYEFEGENSAALVFLRALKWKTSVKEIFVRMNSHSQKQKPTAPNFSIPAMPTLVLSSDCIQIRKEI